MRSREEKHEGVVLDQLLTTLDVRVEAFAICQACPGWRLSFGPDATASVHYVLSGSGWIHVPDAAPIKVAKETLIVLPKGLPYLFDNAGPEGRELVYEPPATPPGAALPRIRAGNPVEGEPCLVIACGTIHATIGGSLVLFDYLPQPLAESFGDRPLGGRFQALIDELAMPSLGTRALTEAFLKQTIILVLRRQFQKEQQSPLWLSAFRDPGLAPAVLAILQRPSNPFTLEDLASTAAMSRSVFAARFAAAFRQPPIEFLKKVRLQRAARLLEMTALPVKVVAASVGYESRSYFSRAFREAYGADPTEYRAHQQIRVVAPSRPAAQCPSRPILSGVKRIRR